MQKRTRPPTHPGGIIKRHYLAPLDLSIASLALRLGISRKTLSNIVNEKAPITPETALRLAQALNTSPELWMNLQSKYTLWQLRKDRPELASIKPLKLQNSF